METPRKPLNKYWCSVPHYLSDIINIYIKADRFPLMMLTAERKRRNVVGIDMIRNNRIASQGIQLRHENARNE
jgi:hypothetical protein